MKERILSILLCLCMVMALLPATALAAGATQINHVDIVIELPKAGESNDSLDYTPKVKSIKSGSIDLLAKGASIMESTWTGDDIVTEDDEYFFRGGTTYLVDMQLDLGSSGYCAKYTTVSGEAVATPDTFSVTVNGVPATINMYTAPYYPTFQVSLTIEGERMSAEEKEELAADRLQQDQERAKALRLTATPITMAQAKARQHEATETLVIKNTADPIVENPDSIRTVILDATHSSITEYIATRYQYVEEIWLSSSVDVARFILNVSQALYDSITGTYEWEDQSDGPFDTADGVTVFIPESAAAALREQTLGFLMPYTIKTYAGSDVYAAQKAGASAAKDVCQKHQYTTQIRSADRVYTFNTGCRDVSWRTFERYYYSCAICGKCENNKNHVAPNFNISEEVRKQLESMHGHTVKAENPTDDAYIGVNAAGEHIYWMSCESCGKSWRNIYQHLTEADIKGMDGTLQQIQAMYNQQIKRQETEALNSTETQADMFALRTRSTAKISAWAQGDVNTALNNNLLDTALLGNDYTKAMTRLQFCSVAVRLAEELTGKEITPAPSGTFTDTDALYARKAYASGITTGVTDTTFAPNGTLNRQQMATFIYRALQYVEKDSSYRYTDYTSKLSGYVDNGQIQSWATESMAFMNALDLVKGTGSGLNPNGICTIEQAVAVASRSIYAHQIGWYQVEPKSNDLKINPETGKYEFVSEGNASVGVGITFREGDIVWVTGRRTGIYNTEGMATEDVSLWSGSHPVITPYGQQYIGSIGSRHVRPIRG